MDKEVKAIILKVLFDANNDLREEKGFDRMKWSQWHREHLTWCSKNLRDAMNFYTDRICAALETRLD